MTKQMFSLPAAHKLELIGLLHFSSSHNELDRSTKRFKCLATKVKGI